MTSDRRCVPICVMAVPSSSSSRGIDPNSTGRRLPCPRRCAKFASLASGRAMDCTVVRRMVVPIITARAVTSHMMISRSRVMLTSTSAVVWDADACRPESCRRSLIRVVASVLAESAACFVAVSWPRPRSWSAWT